MLAQWPDVRGINNMRSRFAGFTVVFESGDQNQSAIASSVSSSCVSLSPLSGDLDQRLTSGRGCATAADALASQSRSHVLLHTNCCRHGIPITDSALLSSQIQDARPVLGRAQNFAGITIGSCEQWRPDVVGAARRTDPEIDRGLFDQIA